MAKCSKRLISVNTILPGIILSIFLLIIVFLILFILILYSHEINWRQLNNYSYLWYLCKIIYFTFWQAFVSTLLSIIPAILIAKSFFQRNFIGRGFLLRLCSIIYICPVLVIVMGLLTVYGRVGWIYQILNKIGYSYSFIPYGIKGILLVHVFLNLPFSIRALLSTLENISIEQRQLAINLSMNSWQIFHIIEWPYLKRQILSISSIIFISCFTSFSTVLILGGGPKSTTIELAIYQLLSYDFNFKQTALLALIQLFFCFIFVLCSQKFNIIFPITQTKRYIWNHPDDNIFLKIYDKIIILIACFFIISPIVAIIIDGLNSRFFYVLTQPMLWRSLINSIYIALSSGLICIVFTIILLWSYRELKLSKFTILYRMVEFISLMILTIPGIVLATSFFLLLNIKFHLTYSLYNLLIFINVLITIPYAFKILENPMYDVAKYYNVLCSSLQIKGISRFFIIEFKILKYIIGQAFVFSCIMSIGDTSIIMLFGNENFNTLSYYYYQQLIFFHPDEAAVIALLMLLLCFGFYNLIEYFLWKQYDKNKKSYLYSSKYKNKIKFKN